MKRTLQIVTIVILLIFCNVQVYAQSPGGVGTTNLTAWFNPDGLPLGNATSWTTTFPTGTAAITLTDATAPFPIVTNTPTGNTSNYNKTINFAGNGTGTNSTARALEFIGTLNLLDNRIAASQGTFFAAYYINDNGSGGQHVVDYRESVGDAIQFRYLSANSTRLALGNTGSSTNATRNFADNSRPMVFSYSGNRSSTTSLKARRRSLDITTSSASQAGNGGRIGLLVGARKNGAGNYLGAHRSFISELIFFNTDLSLIDILKVESYLAIKYGATLEPTATSTGGYLTSNTAIASWLPNLPYHNDVIGIARDDISTLQQKQSHSFDDLLKIYIGTLSPANADNSGTFSNNVSYAMIGHDLAPLNETAAGTAEMPTGMNLLNRIGREWCIQNTNMPNTFSLDITLNNFTNFSNLPSDLALLVDDDGNFSNASVFQAGLTFSVNGNILTVSGISTTQIPLDQTRYITLATRTIPAPVALLSFETSLANNKIKLDWKVSMEENFSHYSIEKSLNSIDWEEIGTASGRGNDSKYEFFDNDPTPGMNIYRIKMNDQDGSTTYSWNRSAYFTDNEKINIYPNPLMNNTLFVEANQQSLKSISISNSIGQEQNRKVNIAYISNEKIMINFTALSKGMYFLKIGKKVYSIVK